MPEARACSYNSSGPATRRTMSCTSTSKNLVFLLARSGTGPPTSGPGRPGGTHRLHAVDDGPEGCQQHAADPVPRSDTLVVDQPAQGVQHLDEVGLVGHHLVHVLVGGGDLVDQLSGASGKPRPVLHRLGQVGRSVPLAGLGTAHPPARSVRAR